MAYFEKRRLNRRKLGVQAKIIPADRTRIASSCTVVDLSRSGAKLAVSNPLSVPDEFTLVLPDVPAGHRSRIAWRSRSEVGVRFVQHKPDDVAFSGVGFGKRSTAAEQA